MQVHKEGIVLTRHQLTTDKAIQLNKFEFHLVLIDCFFSFKDVQNEILDHSHAISLHNIVLKIRYRFLDS